MPSSMVWDGHRRCTTSDVLVIMSASRYTAVCLVMTWVSAAHMMCAYDLCEQQLLCLGYAFRPISWETITTNTNLVGRGDRSCTMSFLAVWFVCWLKKRNSLQNDRKALGPNVSCISGGEHECYRAWFETATVVVQHRTFSLLCRRLDTPLFVSVMTMGFGRSHDVRVWFVLATTFYVSATHLGQFRGKQLRQIPFKVAFSSRVVVDCVV